MTDLHARLDVLEGVLSKALVGAGAGLSKRRFAVLTLTRGDGTAGIGEASPLPGYSPDTIDEACEALRDLTEAPVRADPLGTALDVLAAVSRAHPVQPPSARFALETALLDWLGHTRGEALHRILRGERGCAPIPVASLVLEPDPARWPGAVDALVATGATHLKLKIGSDLARELDTLSEVRTNHPKLALRLDGNGRIPVEVLRAHASAFERLELEVLEEPVPREDWPKALELPLPYALDETLRDRNDAEQLLKSGRIRAVVLKPTVLGGFRASLDVAGQAAAHGAGFFVSHTFDGPIARAATAELALALGTSLAAGLGEHPSLDLWPAHRIAAIRDRSIVPHDSPGLGLRLEEIAHG